MSCTAEEIAEKKRIAIERLNARKNAQSNTKVPHPTILSTKPTFSLPPEQRQAIASQSSSSFYGKSIALRTQPVLNLKNYVPHGNTPTTGKCKNTFNNARMQSNPYARNTPTKNGTTGQVAPVFMRTVTCSCAMITENRFVVQASAFNEKLIEVFKSIPSKQYGKVFHCTIFLHHLI